MGGAGDVLAVILRDSRPPFAPLLLGVVAEASRTSSHFLVSGPELPPLFPRALVLCEGRDPLSVLQWRV